MDDFDMMIAEFMCEFGFVTTYKHSTGSVPNDATGRVETTFEEFEIEAIKSELIRPNEGRGTKPGTNIADAELMLFVRPLEKADRFYEATNFNPTADKVLINGVQWKIVTIKEYNPSASNCYLYELYIKK